MLILTLRTDKPEAEIGLFEDQTKLAYSTWQAHRQLAETIHLKIKELLESQGRDLHDIEGIVAYKGPGSFTGLRIGFSVANALAYSLDVSIVSEINNDWLEKGIQRVLKTETEHTALPAYGSEPHVTAPKR